MSSNLMLYRKIGDRIRYYKIELHPTLFSDFMIVREYGNIRYKAPTGRKINYFETVEDAHCFFDKLIKQKQQKGYFQKLKC